MHGRFLKSRLWIGLLVTLLLLAVIRVPFNMQPGEASPPSDLRNLPLNILYSWLRMFAAYIASLVFAILVGTLAATSERRAKVLLPLIDILQSIPILAFFPTAIYWFVRLGGQHFGVELAAIFLIFTSQSWNIVFGIYDGIRSVPIESREAALSMGLGELAMFRRLYLPAALPRIIDNSVLSWSNGWYFLMACEIIALGPMSYHVLGIGSFLSAAIDARHWSFVAAGLGGLVLVITLMDVFIWKPLRSLANQYKFESSKGDVSTGTTGDRLLSVYRNSAGFAPMRKLLECCHKLWLRAEYRLQPPSQSGIHETISWKWGSSSSLALFFGVVFGLIIFAIVALGKALVPPWVVKPYVILLSVLVSALRILGAYLFSLAWILPLVYWVHRRPRQLRVLQSSAQILASIPATAFFPLITFFALKIFGITEFAVLLLLVTGMQWYLLFNVLGGANGLPNDIREVSASLGVKHWLYVKRVFLPAIVPALVTGSITAVGGGWNALVLAEYFKLEKETYHVFGIGSFISQATFEAGDEKLLAISVVVLVAFIIFLNRSMWQPLYKWAEKKFRMEG